MSVASNIAYGLAMRHVSKPIIKERVDFYLDKVGLTKFADMYPHQLSGGMRQRVAIARAFANDPEILLMDEPFTSVDEQNRVFLQEELLRIWEETQKTVIFITHSIEEAVGLADRVIVMTSQPGTIKADFCTNFLRPRQMYELKKQKEFNDIIYSIWTLIRDEVVGTKEKEYEKV
jgi:NitT/TauT family transport system ATP-binding protein